MSNRKMRPCHGGVFTRQEGRASSATSVTPEVLSTRKRTIHKVLVRRHTAGLGGAVSVLT